MSAENPLWGAPRIHGELLKLGFEVAQCLDGIHETFPYFARACIRLPAPIADIAYQNKAVIYDLLFKVSAETMLTIAADPKHLRARIGITTVLHTWGSAP